jgi:hypothetical protein
VLIISVQHRFALLLVQENNVEVTVVLELVEHVQQELAIQMGSVFFLLQLGKQE